MRPITHWMRGRRAAGGSPTFHHEAQPPVNANPKAEAPVKKIEPPPQTEPRHQNGSLTQNEPISQNRLPPQDEPLSKNYLFAQTEPPPEFDLSSQNDPYPPNDPSSQNITPLPKPSSQGPPQVSHILQVANSFQASQNMDYEHPPEDPAVTSPSPSDHAPETPSNLNPESDENEDSPQESEHDSTINSCFSGWFAPFPREPKNITSHHERIRFPLTKFFNPLLKQGEPPVTEYERPFGGYVSEVMSWFNKNSDEDSSEKESSTYAYPFNPTFLFEKKLQSFLVGRLLLISECQEFDLEALHAHYCAGYIAIKQGITCHNGQPTCHRCGNQVGHRFAKHHCGRCGTDCLYCRECLEMGQVRECTPLIKWVGPKPENEEKTPELVWDGQLTIEQEDASTQLMDAVRLQEDFLCWAVCGAGKTEILYNTIQALIGQGKRIALAAPRSDVIIELERRFTRVFPNLAIVSLYADAPGSYTHAPLVLTTLHQLRRFEQSFDLIVIDEVDAFPFQGNRALEAVLNRSLKRTGSKVFVTATPTRQVKRQYLSGRLKGIHIPIRFHRGALPEPRFQWVGNWRQIIQKKKLSSPLIKWLNECVKRSRRVFLFVPEIQHVDLLTALLKEKNFSVEGAHSNDPERREKVLAFRNGEFDIMVCTTILERGVTISSADVAVLGAETRQFDERALVQMAGRAGRSQDDPHGDVVFFHYGKTKEMLRALKHIQFMNREGDKMRG